MRNIILFVFIALTTSACSSLKKPFYYEVSKGDRKVHVLGSSHYGWAVSDLPEYVIQNFEQANHLVVEVIVPVDEDSRTKSLRESARSEFRKKRINQRFYLAKKMDVKNDSRLSPRAWAFTKSVLDSHYPSDILNYFPPDALAALVQDKAPLRAYTDEDRVYKAKLEFMDVQFIKKAKKRNLPLYALDLDPVLDDNCSEQVGLNQLEQRADPTYSISDEFNVLFDVYEKGDEELLARVIQQYSNDGMKKCLIEDRNRMWAERFSQIFDQNSGQFFVVVGAAHLVGQHSFLDLLKEYGFTYRRVLPQD